jgi:hypothetical protein
MEGKTMADVQCASNGKGNLGVTLGAIGTGLGALGGTGILNGILGRGGDPEDRPVSRYEMGLISEIAQLKAQQYSDNKAAALQQEISNQAVWNATQQGVIRCQAQQLAQLYSMTQLMIPNANIAPGWGPVDVYPALLAAIKAANGTTAS